MLQVGEFDYLPSTHALGEPIQTKEQCKLPIRNASRYAIALVKQLEPEAISA
jgi:hypothetical protein